MHVSCVFGLRFTHMSALMVCRLPVRQSAEIFSDSETDVIAPFDWLEVNFIFLSTGSTGHSVGLCISAVTVTLLGACVPGVTRLSLL